MSDFKERADLVYDFIDALGLSYERIISLTIELNGDEAGTGVIRIHESNGEEWVSSIRALRFGEHE